MSTVLAKGSMASPTMTAPDGSAAIWVNYYDYGYTQTEYHSPPLPAGDPALDPVYTNYRWDASAGYKLMPDFPTYWGAWSQPRMYGVAIEGTTAPDTAAVGEAGSLGTGVVTRYCVMLRGAATPCETWPLSAQWSVRSHSTAGHAWVCQVITVTGMGTDERCWATDASGNVTRLRIDSLIQGAAWGGEASLTATP